MNTGAVALALAGVSLIALPAFDVSPVSAVCVWCGALLGCTYKAHRAAKAAISNLVQHNYPKSA
jgi:hypothetical protein